VIFRFGVIPAVQLPAKWFVCCFLLTGVIGVPLLMLVYRFLPAWYRGLSVSENPVASLIGYVGQVGPWEEAVKIAPVVFAILVFRRRLNHMDIVMLGVASGLGFAALENLEKFQVFGVASITPQEVTVSSEVLGRAMIAKAHEFIVLGLVRSISLTFAHAVWSAIFAHFFSIGLGAGLKRIPLWLTGFALVAMLHGVYDWLWSIQGVLAIAVAVVSFTLLKIYLLQSIVKTGIPPL